MIVESDALVVVQDICNKVSLSSGVGLVIEDSLEFCREVNLFSFSFVPRLANSCSWFSQVSSWLLW